MGAPFWTSGKGAEGFGLQASHEGNGVSVNVLPPNPFDLVRIKGMPLPGVCKIRALPTQEYKAEKAPGDDGVSITLQGYLPGPIDIELLMWMPEQWASWQSVLAELWRKPGKVAAGVSDRGTPLDPTGAIKKAERAGSVEKGAALAAEQAVSIESAVLQPYNITRVVVVGVSLPEPGPIPGTKVVNIKCLEWQPRTTKVKAARRVGGGSATRPPPTQAFQVSTPPLNGKPPPGQDQRVGGPSGEAPSRDGGKI